MEQLQKKYEFYYYSSRSLAVNNSTAVNTNLPSAVISTDEVYKRK